MRYQEYRISKLRAILLQESTVGAGCSVRYVTFSVQYKLWPKQWRQSSLFMSTRGKEILQRKFYSERFGSAPFVVCQLQNASCFFARLAGQSSLCNVMCAVTFRATVREHYGSPVSITVAMRPYSVGENKGYKHMVKVLEPSCNMSSRAFEPIQCEQFLRNYQQVLWWSLCAIVPCSLI